jgi:lathosterol oxidase
MSINGTAIADVVAIHAEYSFKLGARYFGFALFAFGVLWAIARFSSLAGRPRQPGAAREQLVRETLWSMSTVIVAGGIAPIILMTGTGPHLNFYNEIDDYGWTYFFGSIVLMMFLRDTCFYWTHSLLHSPRVFSEVDPEFGTSV